MDHDHPTRLERLCILAETCDASSSEVLELGHIEAAFKGVAAELGRIVVNSCNTSDDADTNNCSDHGGRASSSSQTTISEYVELVLHCVRSIFRVDDDSSSASSSLIIMIRLRPHPASSTVSDTPSTGAAAPPPPPPRLLSSIAGVKTLRACASLLTVCEMHQQQSSANTSSVWRCCWWLTASFFFTQAQAITADLSSSPQAQHGVAFALNRCLQNQIARSSVGATCETFRLPGALFDPKAAVRDIDDLLFSADTAAAVGRRTHDEDDEVDRNKKKVQTLISDSRSCIKCLAPLAQDNVSLDEQVSVLVSAALAVVHHHDGDDHDESYFCCKTTDESSTNEEALLLEKSDGQFLDSLLLLHHHVITAPLVVPQLACSLQQIIGDLTNLLFRASSQTPRNSPNVGFLCLLVCEVTAVVGAKFAPSLVAAAESSSSSSPSSPSSFLFSTSVFDKASLGGRWLGDGDVAASCAKLDVALGCALDCLMADIESAVSEGCRQRSTVTAKGAPADAVVKDPTGQNRDARFRISEPLRQLVVALVHPLLSALRCYDDDVLCQRFRGGCAARQQEKLVAGLRDRIMFAMVRLVVSYCERSEECETDGKERDDGEERQRADDVTAFLDLVRNHPFLKGGGGLELVVRQFC